MERKKNFLYIGNHLKERVGAGIPDLRGCKDFELQYQRDVLPCKECTDGKVDALVYNIEGETKTFAGYKKCSKCQNRELLEDSQKRSLEDGKRLLHDRLMKDYFFIPDGLNAAGFKNYVETNNVTTRAKEEVIRFTKNILNPDTSSYNLLIMGNPGTGKTHLCAAAARTLQEKGFNVGFMTTGQLLAKIKSTFQKNSSQTEEDVFRDIKKLDVLVLDDLGSEAGGSEEWRKAMLFQVIESRMGKPTIYTSNLTDTDLQPAVGKRVTSRLYQKTKFVDLFTDDYRRNFQIK